MGHRPARTISSVTLLALFTESPCCHWAGGALTPGSPHPRVAASSGPGPRETEGAPPAAQFLQLLIFLNTVKEKFLLVKIDVNGNYIVTCTRAVRGKEPVADLGRPGPESAR